MNITITPAVNGYIVSDGHELFVATSLQEAFEVVVAALKVDKAVLVVDGKSDLSH